MTNDETARGVDDWPLADKGSAARTSDAPYPQPEPRTGAIPVFVMIWYGRRFQWAIANKADKVSNGLGY